MSIEFPHVPFNDLSRIHIPLLPEFKNSLEELVKTSSLVLGNEVLNFEREISGAENARFAVGVNNGTNAIELALRSLGVGAGDEVIVPAFTFIATAFAVLSAGAVPTIVDVDSKSGLLDLQSAEQSLTAKTKALVLVTIHGRVDNLQAYKDFCSLHNLKFIIDGAQSHIGTYRNLGQVNFCDALTLSFYPGKNLGALGEGGAILTNNFELDATIRLMRDWGAKEKYHHDSWGGNFRMEAVQAAFLRIKLKRLKQWTLERQRIAQIFRSEFKENHLMSEVSAEGSHVFHIFSLNLVEREFAVKVLSDRNIAFGFHYPRAIHQNKALFGQFTSRTKLPEAEKLAAQTLSIPLFPMQTESEIDRVIQAVNSF